jgi:hypothetical protein
MLHSGQIQLDQHRHHSVTTQKPPPDANNTSTRSRLHVSCALVKSLSKIEDNNNNTNRKRVRDSSYTEDYSYGRQYPEIEQAMSFNFEPDSALLAELTEWQPSPAVFPPTSRPTLQQPVGESFTINWYMLTTKAGTSCAIDI